MSDTNNALDSIIAKKSFKEISREIKAEMNMGNPFNEMRLKLLHDWALPIYSNSKIQNTGRILIADLSFQMSIYKASDIDKLLNNKPYNYVVYIHHDGNEVLKMYNDPEKKPKDTNEVVLFIETDDGKFDFGKIVRIKFGSKVKSDLEKKSGFFESNEELLAERYIKAAYSKGTTVANINKVENEKNTSDFKDLLVKAIINEHKNLKFDDFSWLLLIVEGVEYIGFKLPNLIFEGSHWLRTKMYKDKKYWNGALPEKEYEPPFFPDFIFYNNPKDRKIAIKNILIEPISKLQKEINEKISSNNPINHILRKEINKIFENIYQIMGDFIDKLSNFEIPDGLIDQYIKRLNAFWVGLYNGILGFIAGIMDLVAIIILVDTQQFGYKMGDSLKETFENLFNDIVYNTEDFFKKIIKKVFDFFVNFAIWYETYDGKIYYILKEIGELIPDVLTILIPVLKGSKITKGAGALNTGREIGEEATQKTVKEFSEAEAEQFAKTAKEALENGTARETVEKAGKEAEGKLDDLVEEIQIRTNLISKVPNIKLFNQWFDDLTFKEFDILWKNSILRRKVEERLRYPGGYHEWLMVSRANVFKKWGVKASQIRTLRTKISEVIFKNPPGLHGGKGSTKAHNEILKLIDESKDYEEFIEKLFIWSEKRLEGGSQKLPKGFLN